MGLYGFKSKAVAIQLRKLASATVVDIEEPEILQSSTRVYLLEIKTFVSGATYLDDVFYLGTGEAYILQRLGDTTALTWLSNQTGANTNVTRRKDIDGNDVVVRVWNIECDSIPVLDINGNPNFVFGVQERFGDIHIIASSICDLGSSSSDSESESICPEIIGQFSGIPTFEICGEGSESGSGSEGSSSSESNETCYHIVFPIWELYYDNDNCLQKREADPSTVTSPCFVGCPGSSFTSCCDSYTTTLFSGGDSSAVGTFVIEEEYYEDYPVYYSPELNMYMWYDSLIPGWVISNGAGTRNEDRWLPLPASYGEDCPTGGFVSNLDENNVIKVDCDESDSESDSGSASEVTILILTASNEDNGYWGDGGDFYTIYMEIGRWTLPVHVWARFSNVAILQGATITSATLTFIVEVVPIPGGDPIEGIAYFNDVDNAVNPTSNADAAGKTLTTAGTSYSKALPGAAGTSLVIDVTDQVQEIVDRAGWTTESDMMAILKTTQTNEDAVLELYSYDHTDRPSLEITYIE